MRAFVDLLIILFRKGERCNKGICVKSADTNGPLYLTFIIKMF
jgi:hypothetical protein